MAHFQQLHFVQVTSAHLAERWDGRAILEIGSHDVNGSIRPMFAGGRYTGVDLSPGAGVDLVGAGHELTLADGSFDLAVSCECFEHNPYWVETFRNMHRMTKAGGAVVITCAARGRIEHGTDRTKPEESPGTQAVGWHYYRNLNRVDFERRLDLDLMFESHAFFRNDVSKDLYFVGKKGGGNAMGLTLDVGILTGALLSTNSLVTVDQPFRLRALPRMAVEAPVRWAAWLPDRIFQQFVRSWRAVERAGHPRRPDTK